MPDVKIRKKLLITEEVFHEGGPVAASPRKRGAIIAVIENPFAGRYVEAISGFMDDLTPDMLVAFITTHIAAEAKSAEDGLSYWKEIGHAFEGVPEYNSAIKKLRAAQKKAQEEKEKRAREQVLSCHFERLAGGILSAHRHFFGAVDLFTKRRDAQAAFFARLRAFLFDDFRIDEDDLLGGVFATGDVNHGDPLGNTDLRGR